MKILVDLDGILVDTCPMWLDRIHAKTGVRAYMNDIKKWNMHENPPLNTLTFDQLYGPLNEKGFTLELPPKVGAIDNLKIIQDLGHDVSVVTARYGDNCMPETVQWLKLHMPWFNAEKKAWFCYDKHRITADMLIDDKAETLIKYKQEHPNVKLVTIDYLFNQHAPADTFRVNNSFGAWDEIRAYIQGLS